MSKSAVGHGGVWILSALLALLAMGPAGPAIAADATGACCFCNGSCTVLTQSDCLAQQGYWQGAGTNCNPNVCNQDLCWGTCCFSDGTCKLMEQDQCLNAGGTSEWMQYDYCTPNPCTGPSSAPEPGSAQHSWGKIKSIYR